MRDGTADRTHTQLTIAGLAVAVLVVGIVTTSAGDSSALGAPGYWAWILTAVQVGSLRAAAGGNRTGWLIGAAVQLPWASYAIVTAQFGFIPGCLVSGAVQMHGYLRDQSLPRPTEQTTYA